MTQTTRRRLPLEEGELAALMERTQTNGRAVRAAFGIGWVSVEILGPDDEWMIEALDEIRKGSTS